MVTAAESIPVDDFVRSLALAGEIFATLRARHPTLHELNVGGGVPPLGEPYDHAGLLGGLFRAMEASALDHGTAPPDVTFELGSLVAAEAAVHVFKVIQTKDSDSRPSGPRWAIVDGGLMAAIPDMLLIGKRFRMLAATGANASAARFRLGDITCDSDGRYPPQADGDDAFVPLPDGPEPLHVVIAGVGAYQEILAGVRGAHHCGLLEAPELILEEVRGEVRARLMARQTYGDAAAVLGYVAQAVEPLRAALE
jgi:arginine decarboxylase-like protein